MNRLPLFLLLIVLIYPCQVIAKEATTARTVLSDLLNRPAPLPASKTDKHAEKKTAITPQKQRGSSVNYLELLGYWTDHRRLYGAGPRPSQEVQKKLLDAAEKFPKYLPRILPLIQDYSEAVARVEKNYQEELAAHRLGKNWQEEIHNWLILHHVDYFDDLVKEASAATDQDGWVRGEDALVSLTERNWEIARPVLEKHADSALPRVATLALGLLYQNYIFAGDTTEVSLIRKRLQDKISNIKEPGFSKDRAVNVLMSSDWVGRDDWFFLLFHDETITYVDDGYSTFQPLAAPVLDDPDTWIPRIVKLIDHKDRAVHNNAVSILIGFHLEKARRDALEPLLPWLSDPQWAFAKDRLRLVQSLHMLNLKQAIPALIKIVNNETGYARGYAAMELADFRAVEAIPVIKKVLGGKIDSYKRRLSVDALIDLDGFTDQEVVDAVESYASAITAPKTKGYLAEDDFDTNAYVGYRIDIKGFQPTDALVELLTGRIGYLESRNSALAANMKKIFFRWKSQAITDYLLERLAADQITAVEVVEIMKREAIFHEQFRETLQQLSTGNGLQKGIAAALLANENLQLKILQGNDSFAQQALLACTRLTRKKLPLETVGDLLKHADPMVVLAAERYLEAEDSHLARNIYQQHSNALKIMGARHNFDPGHITFSQFDRWENILLEEITLESGPDEILALLSAGYWGSKGQRIIRIRNGEGVFTLNDYGEQRYFENKLSPTALQRLKQFVIEKDVDGLGPLDTSIHDGIQYEYVHLTGQKGRRVFMNNPGAGGSGGTTYDLLTRLFIEIGKSASLNVKYEVADKIDDVQILFHHSLDKVLAVCEEQGSMFILLQKDERSTWHRLQNSIISDHRAEEPKLCTITSNLNDVPEKFRHDIQQPSSYKWQIRSGNDTIRGTGPLNPGLWRCREGENPRKIQQGWYGNVVVTPDGLWAVASRTAPDVSWAKPNPVVRIDLEINTEFSLDLPPADNFDPVAFVPAHEKVLLVRYADAESCSKQEPVGSTRKEFYLLNAATGDLQLVTGEFTPWFHQTFRPLQPTGRPDEVWTALPDYDKRLTTVGRYNMRSFEFIP